MLPSRLYNLDVARGLAALAVVVWHWQHFFFEFDRRPVGFDRAAQPFYSVLYPFYERGHLAVSFFFALSGFVFFWLYRKKIAEKKCGIVRFGVMRLARLYPLHLAMLLVVLLLQTIYATQFHGPFVYGYNDWYHFLLNLFFASHWGLERGHSFNAPIWSVSIEVGLYLMFFVFAWNKRNDRVKLAAVVLAILAMQAFGIDRWPKAMLAFFVGGFTYEILMPYLRIRSRFVDAVVVSLTMALWLGAVVSEDVAVVLFDSFHFHILLLYPLTIVTLVLVELRIKDFGKPWAWIGDITYSSYLVHFPLQICFVLLVSRWGFDNTVFFSPICFLLFFLVLIALSLASFHLLERPAQTYLRRKLLAPCDEVQPMHVTSPTPVADSTGETLVAAR